MEVNMYPSFLEEVKARFMNWETACFLIIRLAPVAAKGDAVGIPDFADAAAC